HLVTDRYNMYLWNPFGAAIAGHAIVSVSQWIMRRGFERLKITTAVGIIVIVGLMGRQQIKHSYSPYYASSYHIGTKMSKMADSNDLIISFGLNPCTIYYSKLRGWLFPPTEVWENKTAWDYAEHDIKALKLLWGLGAKWLVISNSNDEYISADQLK